MAKAIKKKNVRNIKTAFESPFKIYWNKGNYFFLFLGFALLVIGYFVMSLGNWDSTPSLFISPVLLIIAYILIFPASIFFRRKDPTEVNAGNTKKEEPDNLKK